MNESDVLRAISEVHLDPALGTTDKAVATRIFLAMDSLGECRMSKKAIARLERLHPQSVRQAVSRLLARGWLVEAKVAGSMTVLRPGPRLQGVQKGLLDHPRGEKSTPSGTKSDPPSGIRRMDMPRDRAERLIAALTHLQRLYDAGSSTDMASVSQEQKTLWLIESERIQEDIDALARHLSLYSRAEAQEGKAS